MSWKERLRPVTDSILMCIVIALPICGIVGFTRVIYRAATCPTEQEVVASIPKELIPTGGMPWSQMFGGVMIDNGGWDYVVMGDNEGKTWQFTREHRGDNWVRTRLYWSNEKRE